MFQDFCNFAFWNERNCRARVDLEPYGYTCDVYQCRVVVVFAEQPVIDSVDSSANHERAVVRIDSVFLVVLVVVEEGVHDVLDIIGVFVPIRGVHLLCYRIVSSLLIRNR